MYFTFPNDVTPQFHLFENVVSKITYHQHITVTIISEQPLEIETSVPPTDK